jgi:hypothetical protein
MLSGALSALHLYRENICGSRHGYRLTSSRIYRLVVSICTPEEYLTVISEQAT